MNFILALCLVCLPGLQGAAGGTKMQSSQGAEIGVVDFDKAPSCDTCVAGFMGSECEAREVAAIQDFQRGWLGWDEKTQAAEVLKIGLLSLHHAHPGSARVANVLLPHAQQSKLHLVRMAAIAALGARQEPSIAVPILLQTYADVDSRIRALEPRIKKLSKKMEKDFEKKRKASRNRKARGLSEEEQQRMKQDRDMYFALKEERLGLLGARIVCLPSMGCYKDSRCTKLLLKGSIGWEPIVGLGKALLRNGSAPCVARVIQGLNSWEKRLKEHDKVIEKITKQRVPRAPRDWEDAQEAWKRHCEARQEEQLEGPRKERDACIAEMQELQDALELMCKKQSLPPAKFSPLKFASDWRQWLKTNRASLPQKYPVIAASAKNN